MVSRKNGTVRVRHWGILSVAVVVMLLLTGLGRPPALGAAGTSRLVAPGGSDAGDCTGTPCHTIGHAVSVSSAGDTINVAAGTYSPSGNNESFPLSIGIALTIAGAGSGATIVDASQMNTVFSVSISGTVALSGMTIQNGKAPDGGKGGGGIYSAGTLTLSDVTLSQNFSGQGTGDGGNGSNGGGIWSGGPGTLTLTNVTLSHNATGQGAKGVKGGGGSGGNGGGIYGGGTLTNVALSNNTTGNGGDGGGGGSGGFGDGGSGRQRRRHLRERPDAHQRDAERQLNRPRRQRQ